MTSTPSSPSKPSLNESIRTWVRAEILPELRPGRLANNLNAGLLMFLLEAILAISFAALIYAGPLSVYISAGVSFMLVGNALLVLIVALSSSYGGSMAVGQDTPGVVLTLASATVVALLPEAAESESAFATVLVLVVGAALATGMVFLLMGWLKLGRFVRFLPYPVMGGFLAGTGWLLVAGGIGVMTDTPFGLGLLQVDTIARWLPGLLLAGVMLLATSYIKNAWVLPGTILGAVAVFYAAAWALGTPLAELFAGGWLIGPFPEGAGWRFPLTAETLSQVDWPAVLAALPVVAPVLLISPLAVLLNVSSLELVTRRDMNVDRELLAVGFGNLACGLAGGLVGYHAISTSSLNHTLAKGSRLPGLLAAALLGLTLLTGVALLAYLPRFLVGGLVVFIGLGLLYDWVVRAWATFPKIDVFIIYAILVTIALTDFLWGLLVGMALTIVMFVISYSQISHVKYSLTGRSKHSRFTRPPAEVAVIRQHGEELCVYKLQGFIFFGTANDLYERIRQRLHDPADAAVRTILLDFALVPGLDSTGLLYFNKLLQLFQERGLTLILTGLNERLAGQFHTHGIDERLAGLEVFADMDRGLEWYEAQVLAAAGLEAEAQPPLLAALQAVLPEERDFARLLRGMERLEVQAGEVLIRQGDESARLFLIESGQVTAQLENEGEEPVRLETMTGGRLVGEVGFYLGTRRTASVVVDEPGVVYALSRPALEALQQSDPQAASALQNYIVRLLGERVAHLTKAVEDLEA